jgi:transcription elongation factor GreB
MGTEPTLAIGEAAVIQCTDAARLERYLTRYRPPAPQSSKYITPGGERRLRAELEVLWRVERPRVTQAVAAAAAQGDRSENAEYTYGKRRLREIDAHVRHLRKRLEGMVVVSQPPSDPRRVFFGARVTLATAAGERRVYRIVGPDEFDQEPGGISMDAPLARALLGKALDAEVSVSLAAGTRAFTIVAIEYPLGDPP